VEDRVPRVVSARSLFTNKWPDGIKLMFQNREHGLMANAISGLISLLGLLALWRHHRLLTVALAVGTAGFVAVYLPYKYFNARFFFAWQLLLCLPLAVLIADAAGLGLRVGRWTQTSLLGSTSPARRWLRERSLPAKLGAVGVLVAAVIIIKILSGRTYQLVEHITEAKVFRNDYPCDYFNITHQAWECSRIDRSENEYPGRALRPEACRFDGVHRDMLTLAPPSEGGRRRLRFEQLPRGALTLHFGRQEGSGMGESCLSVAYGGQAARRVCAQGSGQLQDFQFSPPEPGQPAALELTIEGSAPQGVCFDGFVR
jgi:hypothetical protein